VQIALEEQEMPGMGEWVVPSYKKGLRKMGGGWRKDTAEPAQELLGPWAGVFGS